MPVRGVTAALVRAVTAGSPARACDALTVPVGEAERVTVSAGHRARATDRRISELSRERRIHPEGRRPYASVPGPVGWERVIGEVSVVASERQRAAGAAARTNRSGRLPIVAARGWRHRTRVLALGLASQG